MINLSCRASRVALLLFFLVNCSAASAQKEPAIWLFGDHNGLDFRSGAPVAITNPNISYHGPEVRGVATVTDANGNLLFYAENETVYNSQHDTMQNGSGMNSVWAATQTGLTVRALHDTSLFYLFTINMYEINGMSYSSPDLWYSVIDMKANNGLGAVTTKNIRLFGTSTTQLCAVRHCNERDIWVISHEWGSDAYYAFLVTPEGISNTPVISHSGRPVVTSATSSFYGYMKSSPDGKKIASSWSSMGADLSDFDNETGVVSNSIDLNLMNNFWAQAGGVEFSPNSGVLYANYYVYSTNFLYQYNVNAGSAAAIRASKTKLEEIYFFGIFGGMQRGPDNKIYVATYGQPYVSIIHNPDVVGTGCNYVLQGLALANRSSHNFPAYMESKYYPEPDFTYSAGCPTQMVSFGYEKPDNIISVKWDFDDPASGSANTSTELDPIHEFSEEGTYHVKLIRFSNCKPDTLEKEVSVKKFSIDLGNDTVVCANTGYLLNAPGNTFDCLWQDGSTNNTLLASTSGLYWLQVTDPVSGCSTRDSIEITFNEISVNLGADTTVCENAVLILDAGNQAFDYTWQDGSTNNSFAVNAPGLYIVTASSGNCVVKDSIQVNYNKKPILNLGEDKQICGGETIILGAHLQNIYSYVWEDGSTAATRKIYQSGTFRLTASNECGDESDDIIIRPGDCVLAVPNAFTPDGDGKNDVFAISKTNLLPSFSMQVFNRWGQKIFETRDQSQGWNGTLGGQLCDTGNYAYMIQYRTIDGTPVVLKGMVLLLR